MLDKGLVDGDTARTYSFGGSYSNVIRVEEPVGWSRFIAYAVDPKISLNGWESLKGTSYRVDYGRGAQICEARLPKVVNQERLSSVVRWPQGLNKLQAGYTDILIAVEDDMLPLLKKDEFKDFNIREAGVMEQIVAYPYFHKKHRDLVPRVAAVLKAISEEGLLEAYRAKAYSE